MVVTAPRQLWRSMMEVSMIMRLPPWLSVCARRLNLTPSVRNIYSM